MCDPIHLAEFAAALGRCLPVLARTRIAVANSAGPDSTCLLFLLRRLFPPHALLSVHVLHSLQPASDHMARLAADNARVLAVPHHAEHVPWGVPPFPPIPTSDAERTARDARYHLLFCALSHAGIALLALGHHADDQLETAIIRLARGSSFLGAAGMRPARRWGMGSDSPLAAFGHRGLGAFVLRPLLSFPKERILATCHVHQLRYINDPTNVQPHITPRNAVREALSCDPPFSRPVSCAPPFSEHRIKNAASSLLSIAPDIVDEKQRLRCAVTALTNRAECVHRKVSSHLTQHLLPSPIGTLLLPSDALLDVTDHDVRFALVLRVIRHVSFHPWGSLRADAGRRQNSIHRIVRALWNSGPQPSPVKKFTAGAGVLWTPVMYHPNEPLRVGDQRFRSTTKPAYRFCWLASRMPPFAKNPHHQGAGSPAKLVIDLTDQLVDAMTREPTESLDVLYDCRFLLRIDAARMPTHVKDALKDKTAAIRVLPFTQYYSPKVVLQRENHPDHVLAVPSGTADDLGTQSWISIRWVRPLDAT